MRFHLHQIMHFFFNKAVCAVRGRIETFGFGAGRLTRDYGRIVRVRHHGFAWVELMGIAYHGKQTQVLRLAVYHPIRIEYFMAAVLGVGLGKHHQFHIGGIALDFSEVIE